MSPRGFLSSLVIRGLGVWVAARLGVAVLGVLAELPHPTHFHPLASVLLLGVVVGATGSIWPDGTSTSFCRILGYPRFTP